jgi:hypothetical protein
MHAHRPKRWEYTEDDVKRAADRLSAIYQRLDKESKDCNDAVTVTIMAGLFCTLVEIGMSSLGSLIKSCSCSYTPKIRDRDVQAARNILWLAQAEHFGVERPEYLQRPKRAPTSPGDTLNEHPPVANHHIHPHFHLFHFPLARV